MLTCPRCDAPFTPRARTQRLCGKRECRLEDQRLEMRERERLHRERHGTSYFDRYKVDKTCLQCGESFKTRGYERCGRCSRRRNLSNGSAAAELVQRAMAEERRAARGQLIPSGPVRIAETLAFRMARERLTRAEAGTRSNKAIYVGASCRRCGERFVCMWTNDLPIYCSRSCSRLDGKVRRRARARGGTPVVYRRIEIFERDRWICRLCGKRTRRSARVPDPKAPVIDHIVPLAAGAENGGVDAPWNVQCAHFLCNSIKCANYTSPALF